MTFGTQLKQIRQRVRLSQQNVSDRLALPQSTIARIESDKTDMRVSTLQNLARVMDYEVVLIPKPLLSAVQALIAGDDLSKQPRWQISEDEDA